jgi:cellulose biosynthesis protein BcsQ
MKTFALYNIKGGVGKTASAVNLAYLSAQQGYSTLIWDLDPQGAASFYFRIEAKVKGGIKKLFKAKTELDDFIKATDFEYLDLVPADFSYRHFDLALNKGKKQSLQHILKLLKPLAEQYDHVFLDCPPSVSLMSENVFAAVDVLLVPVIPTPLSARTLDQLYDFQAKQNLRDLRIAPFFSMVDRRRSLHRELMQDLSATDANFLRGAIPYASEIEQMGIKRAPLLSYVNHDSELAASYQTLWDEALLRLSL